MSEYPENFPEELRHLMDRMPAQLREQIASGLGTVEVFPSEEENGPTIVMTSLSEEEMTAMGEAERVRLGVEEFYRKLPELRAKHS